MGCTARDKKDIFFGLFQVEQPHQYEIIDYGKFMTCNSTWRVWYECKHCGARKRKSFVSDAELIRQGISVEELRENDNKII